MYVNWTKYVRKRHILSVYVIIIVIIIIIVVVVHGTCQIKHAICNKQSLFIQFSEFIEMLQALYSADVIVLQVEHGEELVLVERWNGRQLVVVQVQH